MKRILILGIILTMAGCETTETEIQREQIQQRQTIIELKEKQDAMNVGMQGVREENDRLRSQIDELRMQLEASRQSNENYQKDIARLDELVQKVNSAREKDRQVVLDEVSREMARLSQKSAAAPPPREEKKQVGYEHTVKKGETLYAIAKAYGVPASALLKANRLTEKSALRAGQILFIPRN